MVLFLFTQFDNIFTTIYEFACFMQGGKAAFLITNLDNIDNNFIIEMPILFFSWQRKSPETRMVPGLFGGEGGIRTLGRLPVT